MRISTLLVAGITALAAISGAAGYQHGGDMADHFDMIAKHLHLSSSQEKQLKAERTVGQKKMAAIQADSKLDKQGKEKAMALLHNELMAKAKSILTPQQMKEVLAMHNSMEEQHKMMQILDQLGLSQEQKNSAHTLFSKTMASMEAIHNDKKLSDAQKQEKAKQAHEAAMQQIHSILTPEQLQKAMKLHGGGTGHGDGHK